MKRNVVIAAGWRTPFCKAGGALKREDAGRLGAVVASETLATSGIDPAELDEVVIGCVGPPHDQVNLARVIAVRAGVPIAVPAVTVGRNCASGMEAVTTAATKIEAGRGELFLAGGVEAMSAYPLVMGRELTAMFERLSRARSLGQRLAALATFRPWQLKPRIALVEGLTDPTCNLIMGKATELLAREFGLSREQGDAFAVESHRRAEAARKSGRFAREIVGLLPSAAREPKSVLEDDGIREGQTLEACAKLKPYFEKPDGVVTVANSSQITDGAATMIVASEERARALGLAPLARIKAFAYAGLEPARMGLGPVFATARALAEARCTLSDIGLIELNEAFAHQVLACARAFDSAEFARRELGRDQALGALDPAKLNVNGGAIALGHPVGASGARLLLTLAHEMALRDVELGLATLCIGGGQGGAVILERVR
ncbi:MAG: acetyl-CoA C-acyltransferase [Planctomycetes bacterium]|nr:acetyl-CoA C-acyltransferase [Planctomycetota bacterium]